MWVQGRGAWLADSQLLTLLNAIVCSLLFSEAFGPAGSRGMRLLSQHVGFLLPGGGVCSQPVRNLTWLGTRRGCSCLCLWPLRSVALSVGTSLAALGSCWSHLWWCHAGSSELLPRSSPEECLLLIHKGNVSVAEQRGKQGRPVCTCVPSLLQQLLGIACGAECAQAQCSWLREAYRCVQLWSLALWLVWL